MKFRYGPRRRVKRYFKRLPIDTEFEVDPFANSDTQ